MTNVMAAWRVTGTSHRTNNIKWADLMWAARGGYSQTGQPTREIRRFLPASPEGYLQALGEHIGGGDPPSAREVVDIAPSNSKVSSSR